MDRDDLTCDELVCPTISAQEYTVLGDAIFISLAALNTPLCQDMVFSLASGNAAATDVVSFDQTMPAIKLFWDNADESPGDLEPEFSDNSIVAYTASVSSGP